MWLDHSGRWAHWRIGLLTVVLWVCWGSASAATAGDCANSPPNPNILDCNGNGVGDATGIAGSFSQDVNSNAVPDECDSTFCDKLWDGFQPNPPFS